MWTPYDGSPTAEDWVIDGETLATVRKPAVEPAWGFPWFASILYEGRQMVAGFFPNPRAAKAAALAILAEFT